MQDARVAHRARGIGQRADGGHTTARRLYLSNYNSAKTLARPQLHGTELMNVRGGRATHKRVSGSTTPWLILAHSQSVGGRPLLLEHCSDIATRQLEPGVRVAIAPGESGTKGVCRDGAFLTQTLFNAGRPAVLPMRSRRC